MTTDQGHIPRSPRVFLRSSPTQRLERPRHVRRNLDALTGETATSTPGSESTVTPAAPTVQEAKARPRSLRNVSTMEIVER